MKICIAKSSLRFKISAAELELLLAGSIVEEELCFSSGAFHYSVHQTALGSRLLAVFEHCRITLFVPHFLLFEWEGKEPMEAHMPVSERNEIHLVLEMENR